MTALLARRRELRARIARRRAAEPPRRRRRWLLLLLLLLLLLIPPCEEPPAPLAASAPAPPEVAAAFGEPAPPPAPPPPRIARRDRPAFEVNAPEPLPWLAAFRLQVAARSPRLAECFVGAARPGALKWTVGVEPRAGLVSDATLEPTLASDAITPAQRACVLDVLAAPAYELDAGAAPATPARVAMVIEF